MNSQFWQHNRRQFKTGCGIDHLVVASLETAVGASAEESKFTSYYYNSTTTHLNLGRVEAKKLHRGVFSSLFGYNHTYKKLPYLADFIKY